MTLSVCDGAEYGVVVAGTGVDSITGTPAIVTAPVRTGARAWEISAAGAAESIGYSVSGTIVASAFYVRFAALPTAVVTIAHFLNANGNGLLRFDNVAGTFEIVAGAGAAVDVGPAIAVDTWYRVVMEYDTSTGTATLRCEIDNGTEATATNAQATASSTSCRCGTPSADTFTAYYDDWGASNTNGDYEEIVTWQSHRVESLIPNADGTHNITTAGDFDSFVGTAFSNATTNGNTFIAHRPLQRANTADQVIRQELGTTANYMEFTMENVSASDLVDVVRAFGTHVEAAASGASLGEARLLLADNTEVLTTGSISVINSTEDPGTTVTTRDRVTIAPAGGWDATKVDGLKWRIGFADNAPDVNFIDLMLEVLLHVAAAPSGEQIASAGAIGL